MFMYIYICINIFLSLFLSLSISLSLARSLSLPPCPLVQFAEGMLPKGQNCAMARKLVIFK